MDEFAADEALVRLDRIAERRIKDAIDAGVFDNLEGAGKPLNESDNNPHVPEDMRVALKVLANSGYAPDWMTLAQDIEADVERLRLSADLHFRRLREALKEISTDIYGVKRLRSDLLRLKKLHQNASNQHRRAIEEINRKINTFNNTVPIASLYKMPLAIEEEMARYEDRAPAYLSYVS